MDKLYLFCAIAGSAFVVIQFITSLIGLGGDVDGDSVGFDVDGDGVVDTVDVDTSGDGLSDATTHTDGATHTTHTDSSGFHFLRLFSFRAVTAGLAFFGLSGIALADSNFSQEVRLAISCGVGFIGLLIVYYLMRALSSFNANGSIREGSAVGCEGTVYLTIPAKRARVGKVSIVQQERIMEYDASTDSEVDLKPGESVVVERVLSPSVLLVRRK